MSQILGGLSVVLFVLLMGLGYQYKSIQEELVQSQAELQIKENSIKELNGAIANQNAAVEVIKVDVVKKQTVYKDRIQYIEKIVEVEKAQVRDLTGEADCNKSKEILNGMF
jgi:RNA-binding protein YhbY